MQQDCGKHRQSHRGNILQRGCQGLHPQGCSNRRHLKIKKIKKFIHEYQGEDLFIDISDRHHTGFINFAHKIAIKNPEKLHARLQKYVKNLENEEYIYH